MPHTFRLPAGLEAGEHSLVVVVDNTVKVAVGNDAHSVSDQTQSNWNGIIGRIELQATPKVFLSDVQVHTDTKAMKATVKLEMTNLSSLDCELSLTADVGLLPAKSYYGEVVQDIGVLATNSTTTRSISYDLPLDAPLWDEFEANLHTLDLRLSAQCGTRTLTHQEQTVFGVRKISIDGSQFAVNERRVFLRGTLESGIFPLTGYPPTDVDSWKKVYAKGQEFGLNHFRFHSWCPPKAAFVAADELGVYLQVEASVWPRVGRGKPVDSWLHRETARMFKEYGNHPSFVLMVVGNEIWDRDEIRDAFLTNLTKNWASDDSRRLYASGSGWPQLPNDQFRVHARPRLYDHKTLTWRPETMTHYSWLVKNQRPLIGHEIGQWVAYPDFREINHYTGVLKAKNYEVFRDLAQKAGLGHLSHDFLMASGKFQALLYKQEIETSLRTRGFAGFQLLALHDFPGQGSTPVGVLNALWQEKGYMTAEEFKRFNNETVPLARMKKRTFFNDEIFEFDLDVAHFGKEDLEGTTWKWSVVGNDGVVHQAGEIQVTRLATGGVVRVAKGISVTLDAIDQAQKMVLKAGLVGTRFENSWDIWVYPRASLITSPKVRISRDLEQVNKWLEQGETVLYLPKAKDIKADTKAGFRPIFWNRVTFSSQTEHTLGVLVDVNHGALANFPTDYHSNWQWWELCHTAKPMLVTSDMGTNIVRVMDDWLTSRSLSLLYEAPVPRGRLVVSSIDLLGDLENRPVARQLRVSLLEYLAE